jgi:predicted RNA binding protein YcfA (HicA-like mRNA interferase family)
MTSYPAMTFKNLIRKIQKLGFQKVRQKGSHIRFAHPDGRKTTIPDHGDCGPGCGGFFCLYCHRSPGGAELPVYCLCPAVYPSRFSDHGQRPDPGHRPGNDCPDRPEKQPQGRGGILDGPVRCGHRSVFRLPAVAGVFDPSVSMASDLQYGRPGERGFLAHLSGQKLFPALPAVNLILSSVTSVRNALPYISSQIDSFIGERGVRLSGGQQQRVAIAHRLSTVEDCDKIIWLDKGRIKMTGPPGDVIPLFTDQGDTRHQCRQALNA